MSHRAAPNDAGVRAAGAHGIDEPAGRAAEGRHAVTSPIARVTWFRLRGSLTRSWSSYVAIVVLIGLLGGISMAAIAAARRTQASYPTYLAGTNPSDVLASVYSPNGGQSVAPLTTALRHLPDVRSVRTVEIPHLVPLTTAGAPKLALLADVNFVASLDGEFAHQDRIVIVQGRRAAPSDPDEMDVDANAARILGVRVGQVVAMGLYSTAQGQLAGFGTPRVPPRRRLAMRVVGIAVVNNEVIQDDIDRQYGTAFLTPALLREDLALSPTDADPLSYALQLTGGANDVRRVEQQVFHLLPPHATAEFHVTSREVTQVELALKPESVAIGGFGAIAALACLVLALQAIARQLREGERDRRVLRALGASRTTVAADGLSGVLAAIVLGALVAVALAIALSPLSPFGPVRPVYPHLGVAVDWAVVGLGVAGLVGVLGAASIALSWRQVPRVGARAGRAVRPSTIARGADAAGLPVTCSVGVRFALESRGERTSVPFRSTILGTVVAVILVVTTLTFASSFQTLVSHPPLYGWNWSYALLPTNGVPLATLASLDHDPLVQAWTGMDYNNVDVDGETVPVLMEPSRVDPVAPTIVSGHGVESSHQIVLGAATLAALHKRVGDTVVVSFNSPADQPFYLPPTRLTVVGTATFPAIGYVSIIADHTSMGTGGLFSEAIFPAAFDHVIRSPDKNLQGPELVFVRLRPGVSASAGHRNLEQLAAIADRRYAADPNAQNNDLLVVGVQRPAQIVNYKSIAATPVLLAVALALGALVALALTLIASVRRRRRDLALLKTLGFTPRQLSASVAWQATVAATVGILVGVPVGIVLGRQLWILFARGLDALPDPTVPVRSVALVVLGTLVFANLVAMLPGRAAGRTPTGEVLRAD